MAAYRGLQPSILRARLNVRGWAADEKTTKLKADFEKRASAYYRLATERAKEARHAAAIDADPTERLTLSAEKNPPARDRRQRVAFPERDFAAYARLDRSAATMPIRG